jgi:eukaryotic-like serine/threonine-protein kinase
MANHTVSHDSLVGQTISHYRIVEKIGAGGMGEVYRARDEHLARDVAIKVLPPGTLTDASARKHFHKEALILSQLSHPNVATIHDFDTQQDVDFLVMEYIPGITLSEKVAAGPLPEKEVLRLGVQLAEGLAAAHEQGVIHRDLKPSNVRVTSNGRLKILDFGLAKLRLPVTASTATESLSDTQAMAGTLPYMAPEQLLGGEIDARSDLHAAGLVLYEMATGRYPFAGVERSQLIGAILHRAPRPPTDLNPRLSPELERTIGKCLEKEPENRYQSAKELLVDLQRLSAPPSQESARRLARASLRRIKALAVLPLENLSRDPEQSYFADGMTEALITDLAKIGSLRVISRTSIMHYKDTDKRLPEIAKELNVDAIVEGSVLRVSDQVRITAQLIHGRTDEHLWAQSYQRESSDILALQSEVAQAIAREIQVKLKASQRVKLPKAGQVNPEAYEAYLKGRYYWNKRTREGFQKAIEYFQQAIEKDPSYARAYAGLADSFVLLGSAPYAVLPPMEVMPKAKAAAMKALEMDDTLMEAHTSLGRARCLYDWNWADAEREFKEAISLNPGYSTAHQWYSIHLSLMGRHTEAIREAACASELDPLSLIVVGGLGMRFFYAREYDQAEAILRKTLEMESNFPMAYEYLARVFLASGSPEQAIANCLIAIRLIGRAPILVSELASAYALGSERNESLKLLDELVELSNRSYVPPFLIAGIYAQLAEWEQAFDCLERGYQQHDPWLAWLNVEPRIDPLRSDPRFQDLLRRMNFPQ